MILLWASFLFAGTLLVDDSGGVPYSSIQDAIDAASPGDTVLVRPGTYNENIILKDGVDVRGSGAEVTHIVGTGIRDVVIARSLTKCTFDGFSVKGSADGSFYAGIKIYGGSPVISNNLITENTNGIYIEGNSSAIIRNNTIKKNGHASSSVVEYGIICISSTPLITNNIITKNDDVGVYIVWEGSSGAQVINNTITDHPSDGVWCNEKCTPTIKNNIIVHNVTGITAIYNAKPRISYNDV
ncbi:MAG: hypothetical protein DRG83_11690 [Deltaproteobacteria bacterium]|nr:MAG: hypothetical protein DRG83_11690 [Deltaproteobacteria bacterium]